MIDYKTDFKILWDKITNGENFSFARYADGEVMLMNGKAVGANTQAGSVDKWTAPDKLTFVGKELLQTLTHTEPNYYYAISGINDNPYDYNFLRSRIIQDESKITFVNLWINANYKLMLHQFSKLERSVILICNENAIPENFPFKVSDIIKFPNDCINFWKTESEHFINDIISRVVTTDNQLFFISCGPISEIIIHRLYLANPNNSYIDVGSSIDKFVHGYETRPYMDDNSIYSKFISHF